MGKKKRDHASGKKIHDGFNISESAVLENVKNRENSMLFDAPELSYAREDNSYESRIDQLHVWTKMHAIVAEQISSVKCQPFPTLGYYLFCTPNSKIDTAKLTVNLAKGFESSGVSPFLITKKSFYLISHNVATSAFEVLKEQGKPKKHVPLPEIEKNIATVLKFLEKFTVNSADENNVLLKSVIGNVGSTHKMSEQITDPDAEYKKGIQESREILEKDFPHIIQRWNDQREQEARQEALGAFTNLYVSSPSSFASSSDTSPSQLRLISNDAAGPSSSNSATAVRRNSNNAASSSNSNAAGALVVRNTTNNGPSSSRFGSVSTSFLNTVVFQKETVEIEANAEAVEVVTTAFAPKPSSFDLTDEISTSREWECIMGIEPNNILVETSKLSLNSGLFSVFSSSGVFVVSGLGICALYRHISSKLKY